MYLYLLSLIGLAARSIYGGLSWFCYLRCREPAHGQGHHLFRRVISSSEAPSLFMLRDVRKVYPDKNGSDVVAFSVSGKPLLIEKGLTAILAPSGYGKSTLLGLLGGMDVPTNGHVLFEGRPLPIHECTELQRHRSQHISLIFQTLNLIGHISAIENVAMPIIAAGIARDTALQRATSYLFAVGLTEAEMHRKPRELSGGQQQRVAVARAIASDAQTILADEPTGSLDFQNAEAVMNLFKDLAQREAKSIVLVTHSSALARKFADRIIYLQPNGQFTVEQLHQPDPSIPAASEQNIGKKPGLGWWECFRYTFSDLCFRWLISGVTMATVVFSVCILLTIAMLCIRFYDVRDQAMRQSQLEKVDVYPEKGDAVHLRFTDAKLAELRGWPEVSLAFPSVENYANVAISLSNDKPHLMVIASTVNGDPQTSEGLLWGRGIDEGKDQVVVSKAVLARLGGKLTETGPEPTKLTLELQRKLDGKDQIERRSLPIVGVTRHDSRDRVFVPLHLARLIDNWSKGFLVDLNGRHHKEEEGLTTPFAIAYGPVVEESRAIKELTEQNLDVKKTGTVSTVAFSGSAWAILDELKMPIVDGEAQPGGILVRSGYRAKIGGERWLAWDKDDPRWKLIHSDEYNELGWVGSEAAIDLPMLAQGHQIPGGLVPAGARLTNTQTLRWLLFDSQRFEFAKGELVRTPDWLEAIQQERQAPGAVWAASPTSSVLLRPVTKDIRTSSDKILKRMGQTKLHIEELRGMTITVPFKYAEGPARNLRVTVLKAPRDLLQTYADPKKSALPSMVFVTANAKEAPVAVMLHNKDLPLTTVVEGSAECLLIDGTQYNLAPLQPTLSRIWVNGPWQIVGQVLAEIRDEFEVEETLSKMPVTYSMLIPARDKIATRNTHPNRKAAMVRYLDGEVIVEKNATPIKLIPHSSAGFGNSFDLAQLWCNEKLARTGSCRLRLRGGGERSYQTRPFTDMPPDVAVVHDEVFRQLGFLTVDDGVMPRQMQKVFMLGVENPVLFPALEELAKKHRQQLAWFTPIQRHEMNKYQVREKHQLMKRETVTWLGTMRPAIDFAEALPTLKMHVRGELWTVVGSEIRSPAAFEAGLCSGQWFDSKDSFQIVLPKELAQSQRVTVGDAIIAQVLRNEEKSEQAITLHLKVIGLSNDKLAHVGANLCRDVALWRKRVLDFNEAKHVFESPVEANKNLGDHRIVVFARSEADVKTLVHKLQEHGYKTEDHLAEMEGLRHLSIVLTAFAGSLIIGFFLMSMTTVVLTTLMHVQAKSYEIGILRSMGLSAANVLRIFIVQGLFIGMVSFLVGLLLFALTGNLLRAGAADLFSMQAPVFVEGSPFAGAGCVMWYVVLAAFLGTPVLSCVGVLIGCTKACCQKPSDALKHRE